VPEDADEPTTGELKLAQLKRELEERERAEQSETQEDTGSHRRRADKAAYLREKLEQRERAEREAGLAGDDS
jgi:hypothetical protein